MKCHYFISGMLCLLVSMLCTCKLVCSSKNNSFMSEHINNAQLVREVYRRIFGQADVEFANEVIAEDYIQHNPIIKTGKAGVMEFIVYLKSMPRPANPVKPFMRFIADGPYVIVHSSMPWQNQQNATVDLYRIQEGKLVEHWDAVEVEPSTTASGNPMVEGPVEIEDTGYTEQNKSTVRKFYEDVFMSQHKTSLDNYVDPALIQHLPEVANGQAGLQEYINTTTVVRTRIHRIIGEGNFVVVQAEGKVKNDSYVFYDIFRMSKEKIVEQWGVKQAIPATMAHSNGML